MSLFRYDNNKPLEFDVIGLSDEDYNTISIIIEENGGRVVHSDTQLVKFTKRFKYISRVYPRFRLYSIDFIKDCVKNSNIVDPNPYRIGVPFMYDEYVIAHFLHGPNHCCDKDPKNACVHTVENIQHKECNEPVEHESEEDSDPMISNNNERSVQSTSSLRQSNVSNGSISNLNGQTTTMSKTNKQPIAGTCSEKRAVFALPNLSSSSDDEENNSNVSTNCRNDKSSSSEAEIPDVSSSPVQKRETRKE